MRIEDLHVQHGVDPHLNVVPRDADLFGDVDRDFLEIVAIGHLLHEGNQNMKPGEQGPAVLAQILDHEGALLRHHRRGLCHHDDHDHRDRYGSIAQWNLQGISPSETRLLFQA